MQTDAVHADLMHVHVHGDDMLSLRVYDHAVIKWHAVVNADVNGNRKYM